MILYIIALLAISFITGFFVDTHVLPIAILHIGVTLIISVAYIFKKRFVRPLSIFIALYITGQILGYGFGVEILKAVIPSPTHPDSGTVSQVITATGFPLALAFIIDYLCRLSGK